MGVRDKLFPMQDGPDVSWEVGALFYLIYSSRYGTEQSIEGIAERGGFGYKEIELLVNEAYDRINKFRNKSDELEHRIKRIREFV